MNNRVKLIRNKESHRERKTETDKIILILVLSYQSIIRKDKHF